MKGKIVYFLTIVICFLLQCTVMDLISIGSVTPNLMLVFCVSMGLMRGRKSGLWAGFFSGLFVDLFFGPIGHITGHDFSSSFRSSSIDRLDVYHTIRLKHSQDVLRKQQCWLLIHIRERSRIFA